MKKFPSVIFVSIENTNSKDEYLQAADKPVKILDRAGDKKLVGVYDLRELVTVTTETKVEVPKKKKK